MQNWVGLQLLNSKCTGINKNSQEDWRFTRLFNV